jgi:hypothetical protein
MGGPWAMVPGGYPQTPAAEIFFWAFGLMAHGIFGEISGRNLQYL